MQSLSHGLMQPSNREYTGLMLSLFMLHSWPFFDEPRTLMGLVLIQLRSLADIGLITLWSWVHTCFEQQTLIMPPWRQDLIPSLYNLSSVVTRTINLYWRRTPRPYESTTRVESDQCHLPAPKKILKFKIRTWCIFGIATIDKEQ